MEKFQISKQNALQRIKAADHMLTQTYPAIKDTRMLLAVVTNIYSAIEHCMAAVLHFDRMSKKVPPFHDNFESKLHMFRNTSSRLHDLTGFLPFITAVKDIIDRHKSSPVEFTRKDSFVICDENFQLRVINLENVKKMLDEAKKLYSAVEQATGNQLLGLKNA